MNVYAMVGSNFQQIGGDTPEGFILMSYQRPSDENSADYTAQSDGTWMITKETLYEKAAPIENEWREEQNRRVAEQLLMLEDDDPDAEPGTKRQWMDYRIALRSWTEGKNDKFPDREFRPVAPK